MHEPLYYLHQENGSIIEYEGDRSSRIRAKSQAPSQVEPTALRSS